jgi:ubiquinol-cytochrome c reductase cytochrome c subunit
LLLAVAATAVLQAAVAGASSSRAGDPERGRVLFEQSCMSCHGDAGQGTVNGPAVVGVGAAGVDFMLSTGRMPLAAEVPQVERRDPAFGDEDIAALVAYVTSLGPGGPEIPDVDPSRGGLARGMEVFTDNCMACHGTAGQGASVGGGQIAPSVHEATPVQVGEAVRFGPGVMPRFGEEVVSQEDLDSLVRYIGFLGGREPADPGPSIGGLDLGGVGPVVEGLVAWLVGLGLLVLFIRWAGTRV